MAATLLPVDSEHSAVFQAMQSGSTGEVHRILLTGSGGPFRGATREDLEDVTPEQALSHPTWSMGPKITIDSATMMNKALEVIEARWLFDVPVDKIEVLIHPESIVHSLVEFVDGSVIAQLGEPDMCLPIQYALTYPQRVPGVSKRLRLEEIGRLHFREARSADVPGVAAGVRGRPGGRHRGGRVQRRQRGGRRGVPGRQDQVPADHGAGGALPQQPQRPADDFARGAARSRCLGEKRSRKNVGLLIV